MDVPHVHANVQMDYTTRSGRKGKGRERETYKEREYK